MAYITQTPEILIWRGYSDSDEEGLEFSTITVPGGVDLNWFHPTDPKPNEEQVLAWGRRWAARKNRLAAKAWAAEVNYRARQHFGNSDDGYEVLNDIRLFSRLMCNELADINSLSNTIGKPRSKELFQATSDEFNLMSKGREAQVLMRNEINALRDDVAEIQITTPTQGQQIDCGRTNLAIVLIEDADGDYLSQTAGDYIANLATGITTLGDVSGYTAPFTLTHSLVDIDDILAYVVSDIQAASVHDSGYPGENPTLGDLLDDYPYPDE